MARELFGSVGEVREIDQHWPTEIATRVPLERNGPRRAALSFCPINVMATPSI